jgi:hypothetical protein
VTHLFKIAAYLVCALGFVTWQATPALAANGKSANDKSANNMPASDTPANDKPAKPSIVLSPHFQVFADIPGKTAAPKASRAFHRGVSSFASSHPDHVYLVSQSDLERAVKTSRNFDDKLEIAELSSEFGIEKYKTLDVRGAQKHLETALTTYQNINYEFANPRRVAEVALYLALSYIEQDAKTLRLFNILQEMTLLDPSLLIRTGYYPDEVVRVYRDARESLVQVLREEGPEKEDARVLASFADTDFAAYGFAWPSQGESYTVTLFLYSRDKQRFLQPETLEVASLDERTLHEAGNRLMSRYLPCFAKPVETSRTPMVNTQGESPFSLEFGAAYTSFMQFPAELDATKPWGNLGMAINARLMLTPDFSVVGGVHFLNAMSDYTGLVASEITTFRGFFGGDFGVDLGDVNVGVQISSEVSRVGDFEAYADKACVPRNCGRVTIASPAVFVGLNARPRIIWQAYRQFSLIGSASGSYYIVPLTEREFNFPLTGQMSVSYRF